MNLASVSLPVPLCPCLHAYISVVVDFMELHICTLFWSRQPSGFPSRCCLEHKHTHIDQHAYYIANKTLHYKIAPSFHAIFLFMHFAIKQIQLTALEGGRNGFANQDKEIPLASQPE